MATAKKTAARPAGRQPADRPRKRTPVADIDMPEVEVLDLDAETDEDSEPDLVEIFRLGGRSYHIDRNVGVGVSMRMMKILSTKGEEEAIGAMLLELMGEEAFDALANHPGLKPRHLAQVLLACNKAILGDVNAGPKA